MIVAHKEPGCSKLPNSAVVLSKRPAKGALICKREISLSAAATPAIADSMPASADWMPDVAAVRPDFAASTPAAAPATAAFAALTRVSVAKPSALSLAAAF